MPAPLRDLPPDARRAIMRYRLQQVQSAVAASLIVAGVVTLIAVQVVNPPRQVGMKYYIGGLACVGSGVLVGSLSRAHRDRR